jgi:Flp pilus assembly protein TadD
MWEKSHSKADIEKAVTYLERGVSAMPQMGDCVYHLAAAYEANGQIDDARIEYVRLANIWPADAQAKADVKRLGPAPPSPPSSDAAGATTSV